MFFVVANPQRRAAVLDAALVVLGRDGGRALTHRAVDAEAGVPLGTTANYFGRRPDLLLAMGQRMFEVLAPDPQRLIMLGQITGSPALVAYLQYVVERILARPHLALALVELRLEAARNPAVAAVIAPLLRGGFGDDAAFHEQRGLPGDRDTVLALHYLVTGLVLDHLTVPLSPDADPVATVAAVTRALID